MPVTLRSLSSHRPTGRIAVKALQSIAYFMTLLLVGTVGLRAEESQVRSAVLWRGEALGPDEGLFFLQSSLITTKAEAATVPFRFWLFAKQQNALFAFDVPLPRPVESYPPVWRVKSDSYTLVRLRYDESPQVDWNWRPTNSPEFMVETGSLASFGSWYLVQIQQGKRLSLLIKPFKSLPYTPFPGKGLKRMVDGSSGQEIISFQESRRAEAAVPQDARLSIDVQLDLFRQSADVPLMRQIIQNNQDQLRACYAEVVARSPKVEGHVAFTFIYSAQDKLIKSLKIKQAELRDPRFLACLTQIIKALNFPLEKSLIGELSLNFQQKGSSP